MPVTIGTRGRAVTPLRPTGFVDVHGSRLEAKLAPSRTPAVDAGAEVVVVGGDAFGLVVRAAGDVSHASALPGYGEAVPIPAEFDELRHEDEQRAWEDERDETRQTVLRELSLFVVPLGIAFAAGFFTLGLEGGLLFAFVWLVIFFGAAVLPPMLTG